MTPTSVSLGRVIQDHLGQQLQGAYGDLATLELPPKVKDLLARLEEALATTGEAVAPDFRDGILAALPHLRAFAMSLTGNPDRADDLVQETVLRAWDKRARFQDGTNLQAWLFTILRNQFYSEHRKRQREVEDTDGSFAGRLAVAPEQVIKLEVQDLRAALQRLTPEQREALLLVSAQSLPYEEAAAVCGVAIGTIKSRVNRARTRLADLLGGHSEDDLGPTETRSVPPRCLGLSLASVLLPGG